MLYIASPYTNPQQAIVEFRVAEVRRYCAWLFSAHGLNPYSPISHWHDICTAHSLPTDAEPWAKSNLDILRRCNAMHVLKLPGWQESKGVQMEIDWAKTMQLPIISARIERHGYVMEFSGNA
jgi:hypothetical protein